MKTASLKELKAELSTLPQKAIIDLCLHLVKFKKENKELLTYLLFESKDEQTYIKDVKLIIENYFEEINKTNLYFAKKSLRKVLRQINKFIKYSGSKQTEVELLLFFCQNIKDIGISLQANTVIGNIYERQLIKISKALSLLHEDLQYDYLEEIKSLK